MELDRIYNADCYTAVKDIPDNSIDCVYIDIPYLYKRGGKGNGDLADRYVRRNLELKGYDKELIKNSDKSKHNLKRIDKYNAKKRLDIVELDSGIDYSIFNDLCRVMKKINIFIWCSKLQILDIMKYFVENKKCNFEILVWAKTNAIPTNNSFLSNLEYCLYFREPGININGDYEYKTKWYVSASNKIDKEKFLHPTIKPLELVKKHLLLATKEGDTVLDCFLGSGTTAVACKELARHFIGIEKDRKKYLVACNRLEKLDATGQYSMFLV